MVTKNPILFLGLLVLGFALFGVVGTFLARSNSVQTTAKVLNAVHSDPRRDPYKATLELQYTVDGQPFQSTAHVPESAVPNFLAQGEVKIYYSKRHPERVTTVSELELKQEIELNI